MKNNKRMRVVFSIIEHVYWCSRVILLSMFLLEFVCELPETLHFMYSFCRIFWEWDEWLSLRSSRSLAFPSLSSLLMWLPFIFYLRGSSLLFMFCISPLSSLLLSIHHLHFTICSFLTTTHSKFGTSFASSLHISVSVRFSALPHYYHYSHIGHL